MPNLPSTCAQLFWQHIFLNGKARNEKQNAPFESINKKATTYIGLDEPNVTFAETPFTVRIWRTTKVADVSVKVNVRLLMISNCR